MAFSLSTATPSQISSAGGFALQVIGVFVEAHQYAVYLGDLGTANDPVCHSGIPGQGSTVTPIRSVGGGDFDTINCYSPKLVPSATPYSITVLDIDTLEAHTLSGVIEAVKKQFFSAVYALRKVQPPHYYTGPRMIESEEPT